MQRKTTRTNSREAPSIRPGERPKLVDEPNDIVTDPSDEEPTADEATQQEEAAVASAGEGGAVEASPAMDATATEAEGDSGGDSTDEASEREAPSSAAVSSDDAIVQAEGGSVDESEDESEDESGDGLAEPAMDDNEGTDESSGENDEEAVADEPAAKPFENETLEEMEERAEEQGVALMELLLEEGDYLPERYQRGDLVEGVVVGKSKNQIVVNIGAKQEGVIPATDLARMPAGFADTVNVGDDIKAIVVRPENRDGEVVVSVFQALSLKDWDRAGGLVDTGEVLELEIVGYNKGGVLVGFGHLQGFVPRSHFARAPRGGDGGAERMAEFVGETIPVKVIEVSRRKRRLIMSERQALREWRADRKKELLDELNEGEVRKGRVSSIADFGAFVDLGGADGLVHVSEMTYERGKHPRDVVRVGEEVEVYILSIDRQRKRIGLSMKRMQKDPWQEVEENHYVGELVEAQVSNIADFGAFARLEDGLEGLIHISELSDAHIDHPSEAVRPAQRITVEVISIEPDRQRIGLSLRRVPEHLRLVDEPEEDEAGAEVSSDDGEATAEAPTEATIVEEPEGIDESDAAQEEVNDSEALDDDNVDDSSDETVEAEASTEGTPDELVSEGESEDGDESVDVVADGDSEGDAETSSENNADETDEEE